LAEGLVSFAVDAWVQVGGVVVEDGTADEAKSELDEDAYQPAVVRDGSVLFSPTF
jgi:hypothetical protein